MRAALIWVLAIVGGIALLLVVTAMIGNRDKSGETVSADEWAQSVVRRRRHLARRDGGDHRRRPPGTLAPARPASRSPSPRPRRDRTGLVRSGLEQSVRATKTLVTGIDNAGVPDTDQGEAAAQQVSELGGLLRLHASRRRRTRSTRRPRRSRTRSSSSRGRPVRSEWCWPAASRRWPTSPLLDPELTTAVGESSTCQQLKEEQSST